LNAIFVVAATSAAWRWHAGRDARALVWATFCCALGATNHTFMALYGVMLAGWAVTVEPSLLRRPRVMGACVVVTVVGLLPYLYLPLRSAQQPPLDWGDPQTLSRFLDVVLRRHFWERAWLESPADLAPIVGDWVSSLPHELGWAGVSLAALGVVAGWRRGMPVVLLVLVMVANVAALAVHGSRNDIFVWHRYYVPSYAMAALLAGIGCHEVVMRLPRPVRWLPLLLPLVMLADGRARFDRSRYRIAEDFAQRVLDAMPPGAHLIASDDNVLFALMYLQLVEDRRPDVDLVMQGVDGPLPPLRFDPDVDALYFTHHPNWNDPGLEIVPEGIVLRARRAGAAAAPPVLDVPPLDGEDDPRVPKDDLTQNLIGHFHYMLGLTAARTDWSAAETQFRRAAAASPDNDVLFYNLGLVYRRLGLRDESIAEVRRSAAINPRHLASQDRPRAVDRLAELGATP
jgi:tetratricopeptide (TPR) repeat protein